MDGEKSEEEDAVGGVGRNGCWSDRRIRIVRLKSFGGTVNTLDKGF